MLARIVSRKMSKAAERQSLLMFVALQKGIYGKKDADRSVYIPADGKDRPEGVECENRGFGVSHVQHVISPPSIACAGVSTESLHIV